MARSKGDKFRRSSCFTQDARQNEAVARLVVRHYLELAALITDDLTAETFQDTYCRMTLRPVKGDFVKQFKKLFYNTLREHIKERKHYKNTFKSYADYKQTAQKATQADDLGDD